MPRRSGFTLTELMVTVAMAAIVLTAGVPSFQTTIKNNRLTTATNALVGALNLARSEAIKRGVRVTVCKSADGNSCTTSGNWEQGWIVFAEQDEGNAAYFDSASETLLRAYERVTGSITLVGNANVADYVSYVASGQSQLISGAFQAGTIKICDDRSGNVGRNIVLSQTGRVRIEKGISCP